MKEVKPLTCLPVPLSAASNVSGKFQRGQTKINTKHRVPEVAGTAQHHPCQTKGVYLISHQMRSSLGSLLSRVRSLHCRPLWDVVPQYYCFFTMEKYTRVGKVQLVLVQVELTSHVICTSWPNDQTSLAIFFRFAARSFMWGSFSLISCTNSLCVIWHLACIMTNCSL